MALAVPEASWLAQHTSPAVQFAELEHERAKPVSQLPFATQLALPPLLLLMSTQQSCFESSHVVEPHVIELLTVPVVVPPPLVPPPLLPPLPPPLLPVPPLALPPDPDPEDPFPFAPFVVSVSGASFPPHAAARRRKANSAQACARRD